MEEYYHEVKIVEFQAWNNVKGEEPQHFLILQSEPLDESNEMNVKSKYHEKCMYAAISGCDTHTVKVLDEQGNVWMGCETTFQHGHSKQEEE